MTFRKRFIRAWWRCFLFGFHAFVAGMATVIVIGLIGWLANFIFPEMFAENFSPKSNWVGWGTFLLIALPLLGYFIQRGPERKYKHPEIRAGVRNGVWRKPDEVTKDPAD